ncbi:MAG: DUF1697 domain-containing protein, partial [Herbiconiux sp.]|nr:DUF1697 domain-containing protein [Herbiconiux sp.]
SGNVLFETASDDETHAALKARIEKALGERFGYDAWIVLVEHADLEGIVAGFPYPEVDGMQPYVLFASDAAALAEVSARAAELDPADGERAEPGPGVLYWEVARGSSTDTPFAKFLARARFKAVTTTRNLRTLRKLL